MNRHCVAGIISGLVLAGFAAGQAIESLPGPVIHPYSFELLSNSRYSVHPGFTDTLPRQVLANVLWAMEQVPRFDSFRELYVATKDNVYLYNPPHNTLVIHKPGDFRYSSGSTFEVGVATRRHEETGLLIQAGLLAGTAFWDSAGPSVASCPMKQAADYANREWVPNHRILMVNVYGLTEVKGLDTNLVAVSSDSSLFQPYVTGPDSFEIILMGLHQDSVFSPYTISHETVSQLLWAGCGVTPHRTDNSPCEVYLVHNEGVDHYCSRFIDKGVVSADHRLERIVPGDRKPLLYAASSRIPSSAPVYMVVCVKDTGSYRTMQESGYFGFQVLVQAKVLGLSGFLTLPLTPEERSSIALALFLPTGQYPVLVFSTGEPATGVSEEERPALVEITRAKPVIRLGESVRVEYLLRKSGQVRAEVYDMLGRPVRHILKEHQSTGYHSVEWDGADDNTEQVKKGSYVIGIFAPGSVAQHKITVF